MPDMFTQFIGMESLYSPGREGVDKQEFKKDLIAKKKLKRAMRKPTSPNFQNIGSNLSNLDLTMQTSA